MDGGYDAGYEAVPCFWGHEPGSLVTSFLMNASDCTGWNVLDVGGGEGKNAYAFARAGANVTVIDTSQKALLNGRAAFPHPNIEWTLGDVRSEPFPRTQDVIVCYGLIHCLESEGEASSLIDRLKDVTRPDGHHLLCAFNDRSQDLELAHPGFQPLLLPHDWFVEKYLDWNVVHQSDTDLVETHPHNNIEHRHSMTRLTIRRPG